MVHGVECGGPMFEPQLWQKSIRSRWINLVSTATFHVKTHCPQVDAVGCFCNETSTRVCGERIRYKHLTMVNTFIDYQAELRSQVIVNSKTTKSLENLDSRLYKT